MHFAELQRDVLAAVESELQDGRKLLRLDQIIENLVAAYGEGKRLQITKWLVTAARAKGVVVVWSSHSRSSDNGTVGFDE